MSPAVIAPRKIELTVTGPCAVVGVLLGSVSIVEAAHTPQVMPPGRHVAIEPQVTLPLQMVAT